MTALLAIAALLASTAPDMTDGELWNEGVGYYEAGDVTNALETLRRLMLSKSHGARAAEVVAKLEHARGNDEEAAFAAQLALRAAPEDPRVNRNFTRATDGLAEKREQKRIERILKAAEGQDPGALLGHATAEARALLKESGTYRTNAAPRAVELADRLSARAERLADAWIPVRAAIAQSVTNEEQAATIIAQLDEARMRTRKSAKELADLDGAAYGSLGATEEDFTRFLKLVALPPQAIAEDHLSQTNGFMDVETVNGRAWQPDALDYTRAFRAKFPAWAQAYERAAQADTNKPPFTAEAQAKISALATELEKVQIACCEKPTKSEQLKALDLIDEIRFLLPDDGKGGGAGSPQANPDQKDQNEQNKNQENGQNDQPQTQDGQKDESSDDVQQDDPDQQPKEDSAEEGEKDEPPPEDKELEALLRKAQERNDEHEAEKRARMRKDRRPPDERDW